MRFLKSAYYVVARGALVFCGRSDPKKCIQIEKRLNLSGTFFVCESCPWAKHCDKKRIAPVPNVDPPRRKEKGTEV